jgi:hypothetical protein
MEPTPANSAGGKSTDQRKPFGRAIARLFFPSENQLCNNAARVIAQTKLQELANMKLEIKDCSSLKSPIL